MQVHVPLIYDVRAENNKKTIEYGDVATGLARAAEAFLLESTVAEDVALLNSLGVPEARIPSLVGLINTKTPTIYPNPLRSQDLLCDTLIRRLLSHVRRTRRRLVLVFDNCDQLSPDGAAFIMGFARSVALRHTSLRCVIAVRPFALFTSIERNVHAGGFTQCWIELPPPDLAGILLRRLQAQNLQTSRTQLATGNRGDVVLDFQTLEKAIARIVLAALPSANQQFITTQVCNRNIRKSLLAFHDVVACNDKRLTRLITGNMWQDRHDGQFSWETVLGAIMRGKRQHYIEQGERENVVLNLFDVGIEQRTHYSTHYRVLQFLAYHDRPIELSLLYQYCESIRLPSEAVASALTRMLHFGLLSSPEHDDDASNVLITELTDTGRSYVERFTTSGVYLWNVVPDVLLTHRELRKNMRSWAARFDSMIELLTRIRNEEEAQITTCDQAWALDPLFFQELLASRVASALLACLDDARHSEISAVLRDMPRVAERVRDAVRATLRWSSAHQSSLSSKTSERHFLRKLVVSGDRRLRVVARRDLGNASVFPLEITWEVPEALSDVPTRAYVRLSSGEVVAGSDGCIELGCARDMRRGSLLVRSQPDELPRGRVLVTADGRIASGGTFCAE